jgi:hypothetical protein
MKIFFILHYCGNQKNFHNKTEIQKPHLFFKTTDIFRFFLSSGFRSFFLSSFLPPKKKEFWFTFLFLQIKKNLGAPIFFYNPKSLLIFFVVSMLLLESLFSTKLLAFWFVSFLVVS